MSEDRSAGVLQDGLEALARRVEELNTELAAVRRELREQRLQATEFVASVAQEELGSESADPSVVTSLAVDQPEMSRRNALRAAGVLAAGAVAGGVGLVAAATPAAAATGTFNGGSPAVTANGGSGTDSIGVDARAGGINGIAVAALSSGINSVAVMGGSVGAGGVGVRGDGDFSGVWGSSDTGVGVYGETMAQVAIYGTSGGVASDSAGVYGRSMSGRGLHGHGSVGVFASGLDVGVSIEASETSLRFSNDATSPLTSGGTYQARDIVVDSAGVIWFCVAGGTPGTWRMLSGPSTAGAFTPLTPGRVYDSRLGSFSPNGALGSGQNRTISVANSYDPFSGTLVTTNFVPAGATAVFANVTVVETAGNGWLAVNPGGTMTVSASSINWSASGQILANGISLTLNTNRQITVVNGSPGSTQFIVDILGYYR